MRRIFDIHYGEQTNLQYDMTSSTTCKALSCIKLNEQLIDNNIRHNFKSYIRQMSYVLTEFA